MPTDRQPGQIERPEYVNPHSDGPQTWECQEDCDGEVKVWSGDPYYPSAVNCPECGALMERLTEENEYAD